jgi:uncharacterized circularly permuted ATP-grasp superfamily protein
MSLGKHFTVYSSGEGIEKKSFPFDIIPRISSLGAEWGLYRKKRLKQRLKAAHTFFLNRYLRNQFIIYVVVFPADHAFLACPPFI